MTEERDHSAVAAATSRLDVRDVGAVGDGIADDTAALQAALDASRCVELSPGTYHISAPLEIDSGQVLLGCGSTLVGEGGHIGIRRGTDERYGSNFIRNPAIRDLRFDGFSIALDAEGMNSGVFESLLVENCDIGYRLATGDNGVCYNNSFTSCHIGFDVDLGLLFEGMANHRFKDPDGNPRVVGANTNLFLGCKLGGESTCIDIHAPISNLIFTGCAFERGEPGIVLLALGVVDDGPGTKALECSFFGCRFEGGAEPGYLRAGEHSQDCSFFGCLISGGVEVEDQGHLNNWFPAKEPSQHRIGYALLPGSEYARIGNTERADDYFSAVNAHTMRTLGPGNLFEGRAEFGQEPTLRVDSLGRVEWAAAGSNAPDVALYREAAGTLRADPDFGATRLLGRTLLATNGAGKPRIQLDGGTGSRMAGARVYASGATGNLRLGGAGQDGDVVVRGADGKSRIHLDGGAGDQVVDARVYVNGATGNLRLGGARRGGHLTLLNASGAKTVSLDGEVGDVALANAHCAEDFTLRAGASVDPGEVLVLARTGRLERSSAEYDQRVVGVVSGAGRLRPGVVLDRRPSKGKRLPVALMGKVFCKVDSQYAPIAVGDLLTTSPTRGHAMKASDPKRAFGAVLGKALAPCPQGTGLIPILVALQ